MSNHIGAKPERTLSATGSAEWKTIRFAQ